MNAVDIKGDSITFMDANVLESIMNGINNKNIHLRFNNGVLDPSSLKPYVDSEDDFFLSDLYEIATDKRMVEIFIGTENIYMSDGEIKHDTWDVPYLTNDFDLDTEVQSLMKLDGLPMGKHIQGNLGQSLFPKGGIKSSTNNNIQININGKGSIDARTIGLAHEFGHVLLYMQGLPTGHRHPGVDSFVYGKATLMSRRLGYDY